jgi:ATP-binding cassette subfamily F protein 3
MGNAIANFDGATIIISHSEDILRKVANRLIVFHNDTIFVYEGSYDRFLEDIGWGDEDGITQRSSKGGKSPSGRKRLPKKELKKLRADFVQRRSAILRPLEKKVDELEGNIERFEEEISTINDSLARASSENKASDIEEFSKSAQQLKDKLDSQYEEMDRLMEEYDRHKAEFEVEEEKLFSSQ